MATYDSTVRLRQLNKPELSGYIVEVIGEIPNTGNLTGSFYPLNSNPSGFVTTSQTGDFITQIDLDSNYYNTLVYVGQNYYPSNNPSGYVANLSPIVYATGNQTISGVKNFNSRPLVNGVPVLIYGEGSGSGSLSGAVLLVGDQTISGVKTFANQVNVLGSFVVGNQIFEVDNVGNVSILDTVIDQNSFQFTNGSSFNILGISGTSIQLYESLITGFKNISATNIYKSGYPVIASNQLTGGTGIKIEQINNLIKISVTGIQGGSTVVSGIQNVVYTTGQQIISGAKTFVNQINIPSLDENSMLIAVPGAITIYDSTLSKNIFEFDEIGESFNLFGKDYTAIKLYDKIITGFNNVSSKDIEVTGNLYVSGNIIGGNVQNVVFTTGQQTISGYKTFNSGANFLTALYYNSNQVVTGSVVRPSDISDVVYLTGVQTITAQKNFSNGANFSGRLQLSGNSVITGAENLGNGEKIFTGINSKSEIKLRTLRAGSGIRITGNSNELFIDFTGSFSGEIVIPPVENVVYTTNVNQTISGEKTFVGKLITNQIYNNSSNYVYSNYIGTNAGIGDISATNYNSNYIGYYSANNNYGTNDYSNIIGNFAGANSYYLDNSNYIGNYAGYYTFECFYSNFIGSNAGANSVSCNFSNFIGNDAGVNANTCQLSNFIGYRAGYDTDLSDHSNFIGREAGVSADQSNDSNFIGTKAGYLGLNSSKSNFIGYSAGESALNAKNSIFIGTNAGYSNNLNNGENDFSILIGNYTSGKKNSIAIGQGAANSYEKQLNIGNVIYASGINTGINPSSSPALGRVGVLVESPLYTLDVNGSGNFRSGLFVSGISVLTGINTSSFITTSQTGNFVNLNTSQVISGIKTFLTGVVVSGVLSGKNIISENRGYGAGIYTFQKELSSNTSGDIFKIENLGIDYSSIVCDVMINSSWYVGKKYSVIYNPLNLDGPATSSLTLNNGPITSIGYTHDFDVKFQGLYAGNGFKMNIKNTGNYPQPTNYLITLFLGGIYDRLNVTDYS
jgi:hypothetical protein